MGGQPPRRPLSAGLTEDVGPAGARREEARLAPRGVPSGGYRVRSPGPPPSVPRDGCPQQPGAGYAVRDHGPHGSRRVWPRSGSGDAAVQARGDGSPRRRLDPSCPPRTSSRQQEASHEPRRGGAHCAGAPGGHASQEVPRRGTRRSHEGDRRQRQGQKSKEKGSKGHGDSWGDGHSHGKGQGHHGGNQERGQEDRNEPDRKEHDKRKRK